MQLCTRKVASGLMFPMISEVTRGNGKRNVRKSMKTLAYNRVGGGAENDTNPGSHKVASGLMFPEFPRVNRKYKKSVIRESMKTIV